MTSGVPNPTPAESRCVAADEASLHASPATATARRDRDVGRRASLAPRHPNYSPAGAFAKPLTEPTILCLLGRAAIATGKEHALLRIRPKALALLARLRPTA